MHHILAVTFVVAFCGHASAQPNDFSLLAKLQQLPESSRLSSLEEGAEIVAFGPEIRGTTDGRLLVMYVHPYLVIDEVTAPTWQVLKHHGMQAATEMACAKPEVGHSTVDDAWIDPRGTTMVIALMHRCELSETSETTTYIIDLPASDRAQRWETRPRDVTWLQLEDRAAQVEFLLERLRERSSHDDFRLELRDWRKSRAEFLSWWEPRYPKHPSLAKVRRLRAPQ
jgi:hypothetical protein